MTVLRVRRNKDSVKADCSKNGGFTDMEISVNSPLFLSHFFRSRPGAEGVLLYRGEKDLDLV